MVVGSVNDERYRMQTRENLELLSKAFHGTSINRLELRVVPGFDDRNLFAWPFRSTVHDGRASAHKEDEESQQPNLDARSRVSGVA